MTPLPPPDVVISLGPNCKNTWNLRDFFKTERSYPFDWWITPARSMLRMIDRDFRFAVKREDLYITPPENGGNSVYNTRLNLLHHHDFDRHRGVVQEITDEAIDNLNAKYTFLFRRFWETVDAARNPLFLLNGIYSGWPERTPDGGTNPALNSPMPAQAFVTAVRQALGDKARVAIINISKVDQDVPLEGGVMFNRQDLGQREGLPPGQNYAEPVHVFRSAYAAMGLRPGLLADAETSDNLRISNNIPKIR